MEHPDISRRNILKSSALGMGALGTVAVATPAEAAPAAAAPAAAVEMDDAFLKIEGIPGESLDSRHRDEIYVHAFSWGVTRKVSAGGAPLGRPDLEALSFVAPLSRATPLLFLASVKGTRIPKAVLTVSKAGQQPLDFLTITMEGCLVSQYQTSGSGGGSITETFTLDFAKVTMAYAQQRPDGTLAPPIVVTHP